MFIAQIFLFNSHASCVPLNAHDWHVWLLKKACYCCVLALSLFLVNSNQTHWCRHERYLNAFPFHELSLFRLCMRKQKTAELKCHSFAQTHQPDGYGQTLDYVAVKLYGLLWLAGVEKGINVSIRELFYRHLEVFIVWVKKKKKRKNIQKIKPAWIGLETAWGLNVRGFQYMYRQIVKDCMWECTLCLFSCFLWSLFPPSCPLCSYKVV